MNGTPSLRTSVEHGRRQWPRLAAGGNRPALTAGQNSYNFFSSSLPTVCLKRLPESAQTPLRAGGSRARKISIARQICDIMQHQDKRVDSTEFTHRRSLIDICDRHCNDLAHQISLVHKFCALFSSVLAPSLAFPICVPGCALGVI